MPAGSQFSGEDGILELIDPADDSVIGEVPCLVNWSLGGGANITERGTACMKSNGDRLEGVTAADGKLVFDSSIFSEPDGSLGSITIGNAVVSFEISSSSVTLSGTDADGLPLLSSGYSTLAGLVDGFADFFTNDDVQGEPDVTVSSDGTDTVTITADQAGTIGNEILVSLLSAGFTVTAAEMTSVGLDTYELSGGTSRPRSITCVVGTRNWNVSMEFFWQEDDNIPAALTLDPTNQGDPVKLKLFPRDRQSGRVYYHGSGRIENVSVPSETLGDVRCTATIKGDGALQKAEYT